MPGGLEDVQLLLGGGVAMRRKCQCGLAVQGQDGARPWQEEHLVRWLVAGMHNYKTNAD